jgi:hypothetical protein
LPMQVNRWLVPQLAFITVGIGWLVYVIPPPGRLEGGFLFAVGAMNVLFHRRFGRQVFVRGRSMKPKIVSRFWEYGGERGAQLLYLGIGMILAAAGCALLIKSVV